ncbi:MAG: hypothetical protein CVV42_13565 [Candidatus Riflebacteria bacterium HGW-Riflebacteria-2]|jgi:hypothetical protein|nr:MAG: hypothetical protein CVV42_13565 [Candidatus Riflebacteria bacterium HGW-Riflebacteria-2]
MRPDKPKIRAPKIALQQEIREKQQDAPDAVMPVRPADRIKPEGSTRIGVGDIATSLFSQQFLVTLAILAAIVAIVLLVNYLPGWLEARNRPHHSTAVPFELPPEIENQRVPVSGNPPPYNVAAEACYIEGNKLMAAGFTHRAEKMFRQATEHSPDNQKYWDAWQALRREGDFVALKRQMEALLEAGRANEAWEAYVNGVKRDRRFFHRYTPDFAERLVQVGHLASAASILMTFNELHPVNANAKPLLEKIRSIP